MFTYCVDENISPFLELSIALQGGLESLKIVDNNIQKSTQLADFITFNSQLRSDNFGTYSKLP